MFERKIIARNCFYDNGSGLKEMPIGSTVMTDNPDLFSSKAVTVEARTLEPATPKPKSRRSKSEVVKDDNDK